MKIKEEERVTGYIESPRVSDQKLQWAGDKAQKHYPGSDRGIQGLRKGYATHSNEPRVY